ncbi:MAG: AcrR family transcriptional regulator [Verrucomicrobiales bacterium]|jgi:AcrR family transcriptional regulator
MPATKAASSKRDELVDIASELFYSQGYGATGIKQIIDAAGIAKGTFYSHFASKEEVGLAWLKKRHHTWNSWLSERIQEKRSTRGKILALFDFLETWMNSCDHRGCAFLNTLAEVPDPDHAMRQEILDHKRGLQEQIESLVGAHFEDKPAAFIKQRALVIFLLFEGAIVETQNFRDLSLIAAARKEVKSLLSTST